MFNFLKRKKNLKFTKGEILQPKNIQESLEVKNTNKVFQIPFPVIFPYACPECEISRTILVDVNHMVEMYDHISTFNMKCDNGHKFIMWCNSRFDESLDAAEVRRQKDDLRKQIDLIKGDEGDWRKQVFTLHGILDGCAREILSLKHELDSTKHNLDSALSEIAEFHDSMKKAVIETSAMEPDEKTEEESLNDTDETEDITDEKEEELGSESEDEMVADSNNNGIFGESMFDKDSIDPVISVPTDEIRIEESTKLIDVMNKEKTN